MLKPVRKLFHFRLTSYKLESSANGTSAHGVNEMARAHTTHEADCNSPARRYSGVLLLLAIAGLLVACGGGGSTSPNTAALAWDAVTDPGLAGYRIYYGTAPGTYLQPPGGGVSVSSNVTTYTVTGLTSGTTYYFAATAYDNLTNESVFSNEISKNIP